MTRRRILLPTLALALAATLAACGSSAKPAAAPAPPPDVLAAPVLAAQTADGTVGYRVVGSGPAMVMLMGYGGSIDAWQPAFVDDLARTHRVYVLDNAGIGRTSALPQPLTATAMASQDAAFIRAMKLDRPTVLGWSMGGFMAQVLAISDPGLVGRLILCATLPGDGHATDAPPAVAAELRQSVHDPELLLGLLFPKDQVAAGLAYGAQIRQYPGFYLPPASVVDEQTPALVTWVDGDQAAGHGLAGIKAPALVLDGDADVLNPVANARYEAATIPGAQLTLYPDAGHAFLFQDEPQVVARIDSF